MNYCYCFLNSLMMCLTYMHYTRIHLNLIKLPTPLGIIRNNRKNSILAILFSNDRSSSAIISLKILLWGLQ